MNHVNGFSSIFAANIRSHLFSANDSKCKPDFKDKFQFQYPDSTSYFTRFLCLHFFASLNLFFYQILSIPSLFSYYKRYPFNCRCRSLQMTKLFLSPERLLMQCLRKRWFFTFSGKSLTSRKEYKATKLVGYSPEQMYRIVSDVGNYKHFLPFCKKSDVLLKEKEFLRGQLEIGFPPLIESYTSHVTLKENEMVKAVCTDSRLFDHLITVWQFSPGVRDTTNTAVVTFYLSFQFKSLLYSQMANMIFNELVHKMENAFLKEARRRYGKPLLTPQTLKMTKSWYYQSKNVPFLEVRSRFTMVNSMRNDRSVIDGNRLW